MTTGGSLSRPPIWRRKTAVIGAALVVAVAIVGGGGYLAGAHGKSGLRSSLSATRVELRRYQRKLNAVERTLASAQTQLSSDQGSVSAAQAKAALEQSIAQHATQTAQANAKSQYAGEMVTLKQEQQSLTSQQKTVAAEQGQIQSSSISGSGVYVVGQDIKSGSWHTSGDGGMTDNECYFATLNSTDTSNIADNNNFDGSETVDVSGAYAFQISGPCTWYFAG